MNKRHLIGLAAAALAVAACSIPIGLKKKPVELEKRGAAQERTPVYKDAGWIIARASIHNHTIFSDGCRTPEDLLEQARVEGMAVLAITDHRENKICAGKNGVVCAEIGGIEAVGYEKYFEHIRSLDPAAEKNGMLVMKGVEIIPYFYNYGKVPALVVDGAQYHFVEYGVTAPEVLDNMPTKESVSLRPEPMPGMTPWENLVDYLDRHGAIVHSVHPEEGADMWIGPIHGADPPPVYNPYDLRGLTGFAILPSGWQKVGAPGGLWDSALIEYLYGRRTRPLWASADADYHARTSLAWATTLFYMREFTEAETYKCLKEGRVVALQGEAFQDTYVAEWSVSDGGAAANPVMLGESVTLSGSPRIRFALNKPHEGIKVRLIRNGRIIGETGEWKFDLTDSEQGELKEPAYYRVEVVGPRADYDVTADMPTHPASELFVNPIFVKW